MFDNLFSARLAHANAWWGAKPGNLRGALWVLAASFFFSIGSVLIKHLGGVFHVFQILFLMQAILLFVLSPQLLGNFSATLKTDHIGLHMARIGFSLLAMLSGLLALVHIPLANAIAINFSKSFFVTLLAMIFLKEVVGVRRLTALFVGFGGVLLIAQPAGEDFNIWVLAAIVDAASAGAVIVIIRHLARFDSISTILSSQAVIIGAVMLAPALYVWQAPTYTEWFWLVLMGLLFAIGQMCHIRALKAGEASLMAVLGYSRLIYAMGLGVLVFNEWPTWLAVSGALLITLASIYTLWREARLAS